MSGSHRYWRVAMPQSSGSQKVTIAELQMHTTIGGAQACTGGTIISSGNSGGFIEANAFDSNNTTEWCSLIGSTVPLQWLGYDFTTSTGIVEVTVRGSVTATNLSAFGIVQWSNDGIYWSSVLPLLPAQLVSTTAIVSGFTDGGLARVIQNQNMTGKLIPNTRLITTPTIRFPVSIQFTSSPIRIIRTPNMTYEAFNSGIYRIAGTVTINSVLGRRKIRLLNKITGAIIKEVWSDPVTGVFTFNNLKLQSYIVLSEDSDNTRNAIVYDNILPVI